MKIGYTRVSTEEQNLDLQRNALRKVGCRKILEDRGVSGAAQQRPGLDDALAALKKGDTLVVWKLDRLGRSLPHLIDIIRQLGERGCGFQSVTEGMDTSTPAGELLFNIVGSLAQFERALLIERTNAGIAAARERGTVLGRKHALTPEKLRAADRALSDGESVTSAARALGVDRATLYRALAKRDKLKAAKAS